jgi:hypothetical protein
VSDTKTALEALSTGGKRVRVHDAQMVTKLPKAVKALIKEFGDARGMSEGAVVREALGEFFTKRGYNR